jgi:DNA-binding FadR family transcriptional regulator
MATDDLTERLYKMISGRRFPRQSKLPPERELAKELNVTRARLRKALALLEADGKIWRHVGKGTYVGSPPTEQTLQLSFLAKSTNPMEIMEVRMVIEPRLAGFAAMRATPAMITEMHRCIEKSESAKDIRTFELWDATLHRTIAEAAHNSLLLSVMNIVNAMRQDKLWGQLKESAVTPEKMKEYSGQHHDCIKAIEARHASGAERAMVEHLQQVRNDLLSVTAGFSAAGVKA